jgi:hypothetical protein
MLHMDQSTGSIKRLQFDIPRLILPFQLREIVMRIAITTCLTTMRPRTPGYGLQFTFKSAYCILCWTPVLRLSTR